MQLKSTVVIKNVNEDVVFALDLADSEDRYYKFEGVSSAFLKLINNQTSEEKIIEEILKTYEDCTQEQIKKDLESLRLTLQSLNFLL